MAFTPLASNSKKLERHHIGNGHIEMTVTVEPRIGNGGALATVANNMGNGVYTFSVTFVDGPAAAQVRFVCTGRAESAILRRLTTVVSIEGYAMCRSLLVFPMSPYRWSGV